MVLLFFLKQAFAFYTTHTVGHSVTGRPVVLEQVGSGSEVVLIVSTIHGNEWSGYPLSLKLVEQLSQEKDLLMGKTVLILPLANPDGFALYQRNNINWVDLNRNFPSENYGKSYRAGEFPLSETESQALMETISRFEPHRIVTIHEPLECIDYDGKGEDLALRLSFISGLPVRRLPTYSGSLGSFVKAHLDCEFLTIELPYFIHLKDPEELWRLYGALFLEAVFWKEDRKDK